MPKVWEQRPQDQGLPEASAGSSARSASTSNSGSRKLARSVLEVDSKVVDGVVNLTGLVTLGSGEGLKYFETGRAQFYALIVFGGVIALVVLFGALG